MTRFWNSPTFWKWIACVAVLTIYIMLDHNAQVHNCNLVAQNREEGHVRYDVQTGFILAAADRINKQAKRESREGKTQAALDDFDAETKYRAFASKLTDLPSIKC